MNAADRLLALVILFRICVRQRKNRKENRDKGCLFKKYCPLNYCQCELYARVIADAVCKIVACHYSSAA